MSTRSTTTLPALLALALAALLVPAAAAQAPHGTLDGGVEAEASVGASAAAPSLPEPTDLPAFPKADALETPPALDIVPLAVDANVDTNGGVGLEATSRASASTSSSTGDADGEGIVRALVDAVPPEVAEAAPPVMAAAGFLAVLQAMGVWRFLGFGAFAMYSRLTRSELLDNEHRDGVYKLIQENPGIAVSEIAERSGLGWGTTVYHLERLERAKFVASERSGLHRCYFPVGTVAREDRKAIGALKGDTARSIAEFLVARPGATQSELCEALGMSPSAASKQITRLESAGLVRRERDWKTVHLFPQQPLAQAVGGAPAAALAVPGGAAPLAA